MPPLPRSFFERDAALVARELIGAILVRGPIRLRITETEAYTWPGDTACHARSGQTERNRALWGPPGTAYVYTCYGIHQLLNLVTGPTGQAAAALIRACEPIRGHGLVAARRGGRTDPTSLAGPGKVGQALALDPSWSGHRLVRPGGLWVAPGPPPSALLAGPRVGIDYATARDRARPWRFAAADTPWISHRRGLRPL